MAEQTFNAVERVDEYCHLPEEAAYEFSPGKKSSTTPGHRNSSSGNSSGGPGGPAAAASRKPRSKAGADGLREPLLPVTSADARGAAGSSSSTAAAAGQGAGPLVVVDGVAPEGWPREGSIEFSEVKMR